MIRLKYIGHAGFSITDGKFTLLIDPFVSENPLTEVKVEELNPTHLMVTHGHFDHLGDAIAISARTGAPIIAPTELANYCQGKGVNAHAMYFGTHQFEFGKLRMTPAWHGSAVEANGNCIYTGTPCGYVIYLGGKCVYHAGDTGVFGDMALIGRMNPIDCALLPIGGNFTMDPEEALEAALMLKPGLVVPMHYNTFPIIQQDAGRFEKAGAGKGLRVKALLPGEEIEL
ncbi:MAG: metal-dependent hydrolase [Ruminiclostridium sp.]